MLFSTKPDSKGKEAALLRCRQLTDLRWTPVGDIPVYPKERENPFLSAGVELTGMLYSSTEPTDTFVAENVSFETFLSAVANPDSVLYRKDLGGHNDSWAYYGMVCNGLVRYAFDIRRRYSTKRWPTVPGMYKIADEETYSAEDLRLCDVLFAFGKGRNHVAMVTDLLRDETGVIRQIEVSEAVRPNCERKQYDTETFFCKYKLFALWRYDFVDEVPLPDEADCMALEQGVPPLPAIAVDRGNKSNYPADDDVVISTFCEEESEVELSRDGEVLERLLLPGKSRITRKLDRGYYTLVHKNSGDRVEFCVVKPEISHRAENGRITICAKSGDPESKLLYVDFREKRRAPQTAAADGKLRYFNPICSGLAKVEELTEEERKTGEMTREIPEDAANFKVCFENRYGIWTHPMIDIE